MKRTSGDSDPYTSGDEAHLAAALDRAFSAWGDSGTPHSIHVHAQIEWAGTLAGVDGYRSTRLESLDLREVQRHLTTARAARRKTVSAGRSFQAKGWKAQYRALTKTARGRAAAAEAGLAPTTRTSKAWLAGGRTPTKQNRNRIAAAYESMRRAVQDTAYERATGADHQIAEAFTTALRNEYGAEIRLRDISELELRR